MFMITIAALLFAFSAKDSVRVIPARLEGMPGYGYMKSTPHSERNDGRMTNIVRVSRDGETVLNIVGKTDGIRFTAADTNILLDVVDDQYNRYLEALTLSPNFRRDTLFRIRKGASNDWLSYDYSFQASFSHSVIVYAENRHPNDHNLTVVRINSLDSLDTLFTWSKVEGRAHVSLDYSEVIFVNGDSINEPGIPKGAIVAFGFDGDSTYVVMQPTGEILSPKRYERNQPVIYMKEEENRRNLYAFQPERGEFPLTAMLPHQTVWLYILRADDIVVWLHDDRNAAMQFDQFQIPITSLTDGTFKPQPIITVDSIFNLFEKALADSAKADSAKAKD